VTAWEAIADVLRFVGLCATVAGLWFSAGGMRVVVSGRIDERRRSAKSLKFGLSLLLSGIILLAFGTWLANWARLS
jgi:O-antigen/teichoic acid export membrane protein